MWHLDEDGHMTPNQRFMQSSIYRRGRCIRDLGAITFNFLVQELINATVQAPLAVKSEGFKGKRASKKFGHYGKRGDKQKVNRLLHNNIVNDNNLEPNSAPTNQSCSASRKVTKTRIIQQLGIAKRQFFQEQMEKEVALSKVDSLTKKMTKSKEVVGELRVCV
jgi:hypothetical protein